jgi:hypothetical protein
MRPDGKATPEQAGCAEKLEQKREVDTSGNGNAFVEDRVQGRETVEGKTEARRTRRLDLGQT